MNFRRNHVDLSSGYCDAWTGSQESRWRSAGRLAFLGVVAGIFIVGIFTVVETLWHWAVDLYLDFT